LGYVGDYGGYQDTIPTYCSPYPAWQDSDPETAAHDNFVHFQEGLGAAPLYWMGGPGVDPTKPTTQALGNAWGLGQAKDVLAVMKSQKFTPDDPIIWMDIETQQGWDYFYPKGSEDCNPPNENPAPNITENTWVFDGFFNYIMNDTNYFPGVYCGNVSTNAEWKNWFGNMSLSYDFIWMADDQYTGSPSPANRPTNWCMLSPNQSFCADPFGGQYANEVMWQWSNSLNNGYADFDQINTSTVP
jgi:hypothetical protein